MEKMIIKSNDEFEKIFKDLMKKENQKNIEGKISKDKIDNSPSSE